MCVTGLCLRDGVWNTHKVFKFWASWLRISVLLLPICLQIPSVFCLSIVFCFLSQPQAPIKMISSLEDYLFINMINSQSLSSLRIRFLQKSCPNFLNTNPYYSIYWTWGVCYCVCIPQGQDRAGTLSCLPPDCSAWHSALALVDSQ